MNLRPSLRYGNIVKSKSGIYLVVTEIMASGITYDRLDGSAVVGHAEWEEISGVALTAEVLEKCGFIFINDRNRYAWYLELSQNNRFLNWCHSDELCMENKEAEELLYIECKYLHQLQNLFYDLTNTELKIAL